MPQVIRRQSGAAPSFVLPPPFTLVPLREAGDAFQHAIRIAATDGAGTLVHVGRYDVAEFAVVLEPEEPLRQARRCLYLGMAALADTLAAYAPPEKPLTIDWPDAIRIDGGLVGGGRLGWPVNARENEAAPWLVFGATVRLSVLDDGEPGTRPLASSLVEEGFATGAAEIIESFARHLMMMTDTWREYGFTAIERSYRSRLPRALATARIADNGDLFFRKDEPSRRSLIDALATPSWLDPSIGMVRT